MKRKVLNVIMGLFVVVGFGMAGCGGSTSTTTTPTGTNSAPVANAGTAQSVVTSAVVALDGSASNDANGDLLTYSWSFTSKPAGSSAALSSATAAKPTFTADIAGAFVLNLVVNDGKVSSPAVTVTITSNVPDPTAPSTPASLTVTNVNSDSITLNWNASSGGNGGVYSYTVFSNGQQVGGTTLVNSTTPILTTYTVTSLQPSTSYNFTVASTSLAGTSSVQSSAVTVTTTSAATTVNKLLPHPYIVFDTSTGRIWSQCFISPGIIAYVTAGSSHDVIAHQRVDATLYKITTQGNRKYAVSDINTGVPIESSIDAPPLLGLGSGGAGNGLMQKINMISGALTSTVSAGRSGSLINIDDGGGAYLVGEAL